MRRIISRFRIIHLTPLLALLALIAWGLASPVGASPDDDFHLVSTWCASASPAANCDEGTEAYNRTVPESLLYSACYVPDATQSAGCQEYDVDFDPENTVLTERGNFVGGYPPVYYAVMGLFVGPDIVASALVMRIVSAVIFVALTSVVFVLLPRPRRATLIWPWLVTTIPLGLFLIPSNNPSSWAIIGVGTAWIALLGWFETTGRRQIGLGITFAISVLLAAGSRGDAAVYTAMAIVVVIGLTYRRGRSILPPRDYLIRSVLPAAALVVCVIFFITAQMVLSASNGFGGAPTASGGGEAPPSASTLLAYNLLNLPFLWSGVFGSWGLGWLEVGMPPIVAYGSLAVFLGVAVVGFSVLSRRKAIALALIGLALIVLPVYVLVKGGDIVGREVQPRYLLPLIVVFAGLLVLRAGQRVVTFTRGHLILFVATLAVAQFIALHTTLRRYVTGVDEQGWNLDVGVEWWWSIPFSPMAVLIVGSVSFAALVGILAREISRERTPAPSTSSVNA